MKVLPITDEKELLLRLRDGDQRAFEALYRRYSLIVYANILRMVRDEDVADDTELPAEEPHHFFDILNTSQTNEDGLIEALGGLLPEALGEDYEELAFARKMKKKRKNRR